MLLIVAAMEEELKTAMELCLNPEKIHSSGVHLWRGERAESCFYFLKTGVGPAKAARNLERALDQIRPERILVIGYAGALDPALRLGNLVAVSRAMFFSLDSHHPDWDHVQLKDSFELMDADSLVLSARSHGMNAFSGSVLTSSYVLGDPAHKNILYQKYQASIVDMETAALAGVAALRGISMSCIRAISDEARDDFLAPFSHDPSVGMATRAKRFLDTGMAKTYREWKEHAAAANSSLSRFLAEYL